MSNLGYMHYAGLKGSKFKTVGARADIFNYTDIQTAINEADNYDTILIAPGTWTLTTALNIVKPLTIMGMGTAHDTIIDSALDTRTVMLNVPAYAHGAAITNRFHNLKFRNTSTGDCIEIDNDGGAAQDFYIQFENCSFLNTGGGVGIDLDQTTATKDIFLTVTGMPTHHLLSASTFDQTKAGSSITINGMNCLGAFTLSADALAAIFNMFHCVYMSDAQTTGGGAGRLLNYAGNIYGASGFGAATTGGLANDFDATGTEAAMLLA